ncbi:hypothetical protein PoB_002238100 [Plakobranchus ocellatus]|uniref:Uncharacterized protein n=1 Tax=Plakobranchus ocellatus TaxID=259542 RepID=A0AAV3ZMX1_9GAST|nr:hypothetical protein PoB_002238100 [Plakobranchus ocellatus]
MCSDNKPVTLKTLKYENLHDINSKNAGSEPTSLRAGDFYRRTAYFREFLWYRVSKFALRRAGQESLRSFCCALAVYTKPSPTAYLAQTGREGGKASVAQ